MIAQLDRNETIARSAPFDFELPTVLEAHEPAEARGLARDEVRLLVSDAERPFVDTTFRDLPWFLDPGDLVIVNDSETLPAALTVRREDGSEIALHLSTRLGDGSWVVEPRHAAAVRAGEALALPGGGRARLLRPHHGSSRLWVAELGHPGSLRSYLGTVGRPISYPYVPQPWPIDAYRTVYAKRRSDAGSAEMPSAGRPFSGRVLDALGARGVTVAPITLHTGVASLETHEPPYEEWFEVPGETADAVRTARRRGARVVAVGTTVIRALESALDEAGEVQATSGWTDLVITPERPVRAVDALLSGFHEPRASHLLMLGALVDVEHLRAAYAYAIAQGYLWHEFGDVHLIMGRLPPPTPSR